MARPLLLPPFMKTTAATFLGLALMICVPALAQSTVEKAKATGNDAKRGMKKGADRTKEALCTGTKAECEAAKAKDHMRETKDDVVDKVKETKDKVDSDNK
jgi:hypothetical protein